MNRAERRRNERESNKKETINILNDRDEMLFNILVNTHALISTNPEAKKKRDELFKDFEMFDRKGKPLKMEN